MERGKKGDRAGLIGHKDREQEKEEGNAAAL